MSDMNKSILVTGATGMIGSMLVCELLKQGFCVVGIDRRESAVDHASYTHVIADLGDIKQIDTVFDTHKIDRVIHLAALAHSVSGVKLTYEMYYQLNVECAKNVFSVAFQRKIPILFISTVDVFGFVKGIATSKTELCPVTPYGKTKALAEGELQKICMGREGAYTIFRLSPVYTETIKRDIQKRYYLKYPNWAYTIGKNTEYEVLSIQNAMAEMTAWCSALVGNEIRIIKNAQRMVPEDCIEEEKKMGNAKYVLHFPRWIVVFGFNVIRFLTGKNKYTYLLNKAVNPLRTE